MALAISGLVRIQDMTDYGDALTWTGLHTFNAGLTVPSGQVATIERINAAGAGGLSLYDDGGNLGVFVEDGGQVGIGYASPGVALHVRGSGGNDAYLRIESTTTDATIGVRTPNTRSGYLFFGDPENAAIGRIYYDHSTDSMYLYVNAADAIAINSSRLVGINEPAPGAQLHVTASGAAVIGQIIELAAAAATDALQIRDSGDNVLSGYDERGIPFADGNTDASNYFAGNNAGNVATTGTDQVAIGDGALVSATTGSNNVAVGPNTLEDITVLSANSAFGSEALQNIVGARNAGVGYRALRATSGNANVDDCAALGAYSLAYINSTADQNSSFGAYSGYKLTTGLRNIFVGFSAGYQQTTNSDLLIIDNQQRADAATELSNAIIYGVMDAVNTNQTLRVNAYLSLPIIKSGATQGAAGAAANEVWKTNGHASLPDNVLMIGV